MYGVREFLGLIKVRRAGLAPDQVGVRGVGKRPGDRRGHARFGLEEALSGATTGQERFVPVVHIARDEVGGQSIGPGDQHGRYAENVGGQAGSCQGPYVLLSWDQHLATHVAALFFRGQLVLEVHAGGTGTQHPFHEFVDVQGAPEAGFSVGHDWDHPIPKHLALVLGPLDLVGAAEGVVQALHDGRY